MVATSWTRSQFWNTLSAGVGNIQSILPLELLWRCLVDDIMSKFLHRQRPILRERGTIYQETGYYKCHDLLAVMHPPFFPVKARLLIDHGQWGSLADHLSLLMTCLGLEGMDERRC